MTPHVAPGGFDQLRGFEQSEFFWIGSAGDGACRVADGAVLPMRRSCSSALIRLGASRTPFGAYAHDAVHGQCEEANQRVGADALGQPEMDGDDQQVALEDTARNSGTLVGNSSMPSKRSAAAMVAIVDGVAEVAGGVVGGDEARRFGIADGLLAPTVGAAIARFAALLGCTLILGDESFTATRVSPRLESHQIIDLAGWRRDCLLARQLVCKRLGRGWVLARLLAY